MHARVTQLEPWPPWFISVRLCCASGDLPQPRKIARVGNPSVLPGHVARTSIPVLGQPYPSPSACKGHGGPLVCCRSHKASPERRQHSPSPLPIQDEESTHPHIHSTWSLSPIPSYRQLPAHLNLLTLAGHNLARSSPVLSSAVMEVRQDIPGAASVVMWDFSFLGRNMKFFQLLQPRKRGSAPHTVLKCTQCSCCSQYIRGARLAMLGLSWPTEAPGLFRMSVPWLACHFRAWM